VTRAHATTRKTTLAALDDAFDRAFWARLSPSEKLEEAWRLSEELWEFSGRGSGEPGLSRSVARVLRR
jgi:hypothetical protein